MDKEAEMFKTIEEFKKLKSESDNPFFRRMNFDTFKEIKKKQKKLDKIAKQVIPQDIARALEQLQQSAT